MPGLCIPGRLAKLQVSDDGGVSYNNFGGLVDITLNINVDELECTSHDSNGVREYLPNHSDFTLDGSGRWLDGDVGQGIILSAIAAKTSFLFIFTMETSAGKANWTGSAFATTANPSGPLDDTGSLDITMRCSSVVQGVQP